MTYKDPIDLSDTSPVHARIDAEAPGTGFRATIDVREFAWDLLQPQRVSKINDLEQRQRDELKRANLQERYALKEKHDDQLALLEDVHFLHLDKFATELERAYLREAHARLGPEPQTHAEARDQLKPSHLRDQAALTAQHTLLMEEARSGLWNRAARLAFPDQALDGPAAFSRINQLQQETLRLRHQIETHHRAIELSEQRSLTRPPDPQQILDAGSAPLPGQLRAPKLETAGIGWEHQMSGEQAFHLLKGDRGKTLATIRVLTGRPTQDGRAYQLKLTTGPWASRLQHHNSLDTAKAAAADEVIRHLEHDRRMEWQSGQWHQSDRPIDRPAGLPHDHAPGHHKDRARGRGY